MERRSFESAVLALERAKEAVVSVSMMTLERQVADRRMTDALDVLSAIVVNLPAVEADFTRSLIRQAATQIETTARHSDHYGVASWASTYISRMRTIGQGGPRD